MFDFLRNLTKTETEKQQETLSAYLDNGLTPAERQKFEAKLSADTTLRASLEQQRLVKENVGQLPRLRAPRNFTLDPAAYGRPASQTAYKLYPAMRAATALAAVLLIFLFSLQLFSPALYQSDSETVAQAPLQAPAATFDRAFDEAADGIFDEDTAEEPAPAVGADTMSEAAGEAAAAEEIVEEEAMEEEAAEEAVEEVAAPPAEPESAEEGVFGIIPAPYPAPATEQPLPVTGESETETTAGDSSVAAPSLTPTITLRTSPTTTMELYSDTGVVNGNELIPTVEPGKTTTESTPIPAINLLQIGLGILFLVLLVTTLLLRRQL